MAKATDTVGIGQSAWDDLFDATTKTTDDLSEGTTNKYDTGAPPSTTDDLTEGTTNLYDTGVPPADTDDLPEGTTNIYYPSADQTKLAGVETGATADQTGDEMQTAIKGIAWADRDIVITEPETGEYKVRGIHRNTAGELEYDYETVAE